MCRNIKHLRRTKPPVSREEIEARFPDRHASKEELEKAARQYVCKVTKYRNPSGQNQQIFEKAIQAIAQSAQDLLNDLNVR